MTKSKLIVIFGLPGTGKTTVARTLSKILNSPHFNTDVIRDELQLKGNYDPKAKKLVYEILLARVARSLEEHHFVVVDGTFSKDESRRQLIDMANQQKAEVVWIMMDSASDVVKDRVSIKRPFSEADFAVYNKIKEEFEPLADPAITLRSDELKIEEMLHIIRDKLGDE